MSPVKWRSWSKSKRR